MDFQSATGGEGARKTELQAKEAQGIKHSEQGPGALIKNTGWDWAWACLQVMQFPEMV
jgi:hypothetical protein